MKVDESFHADRYAVCELVVRRKTFKIRDDGKLNIGTER